MGFTRLRLPAFLRDHWRIVVKCGAVLLGLVFNPFGIDDATNQHSQAIITRLAAPFYGRLGQDHISAVVITDDAAERVGGYPLAFDQHAKVLRTILCMDPAAVFIDLNFRTTRGDVAGVSALADALTYRRGAAGCGQVSKADLAGDGVAPVFLAIVRNDASKCSSILRSGQPECAAMKPFEAVLDVVRPTDVTGLLEDERLYHLTSPLAEPHTAASPALSLARALCRRNPQVSAFCAQDDARFETPLFVRWGQHVSPLSASDGGQDQCAPRGDPDTMIGRWGAAAKNFWNDVWGSSQLVQPCLYTDQTTISSLLRLDVNSDPRLKTLIGGRIVIYGADITALPDRFISPVHGSVPGLFVHAMATDNLVTQADGYWRQAPTVLGVSVPDVFKIVLGIAIVVLAALFKPRWASVLATLAVALSAFIVAVIWTSVCSFEPLNFVIVFVVGVVNSVFDTATQTGEQRSLGG